MKWSDINQINELKMNSSTLTGKTKYPFTLGFEFEVVVPEDFQGDGEPPEIDDFMQSDDYQPDVDMSAYFRDYYLPQISSIKGYDENGNPFTHEFGKDTILYDSDGVEFSYNELDEGFFFDLLQNGDREQDNFMEMWNEFDIEQAYSDLDRHLQSNPISDIDYNKLVDYFGSNIDSNVTYTGEYHGKSSGNQWIFMPDSSIEPVGVELVSPVFDSFEEANDNLENVVSFFDNYGFSSNASTGFHINIGTFSPDDIDLLKLYLFIGERHVLETFERYDNTYTEPLIGRLGASIKNADGNYKNIIKKTNEYMLRNIPRNSSINLEKLITKNYIEFRAVGNDYLYRLSDVMNTVKRFLLALDVAMDPTASRETYMKKLVKLQNGIGPKSDSGKYDAKNVIHNLDDFVPSGMISATSNESILKSMLKHSTYMDFEAWPSNLRTDVRELISHVDRSNKSEITKAFNDETPIKDNAKFLKWIEPLLRKQGLL